MALPLGKPVLQVQNASFGTHQLYVEHVSIEVRAGEVIGLAGLEGSGQRELLQASAGLLPLRTGAIVFDGEPLKERRSPFFWTPWLALVAFVGWMLRVAATEASGLAVIGGIGVGLLIAGVVWLIGQILIAWTSRSAYHVFRDRGGAYVPAERLEEGLVAGLSLAEHMALVTPDQPFLVNWESARTAIDRQIKRYNIIGRPESLVNQLSGGNQQRAMIALLKTPLRLILIEHPTRGLDVTSANWIWSLFQERRQEGTGILFMSADLDELMERSDRIAVFSGGKLLRIVQTSQTNVDELGHLIGGKL